MTALRLAVAGLGTVGAGLLRLVEREAELLALRAGRRIEIVDVSARERRRDRGVALDRYRWHDDAVAMARNTEADVVVELIGGSDGPAKAVCEAALAAGRHVVTANKALLAHHGAGLARAAEAAGAALCYEAAVAGGIPAIKAVREGFAGNEIRRVMGILNGTCNYMLSDMRRTGRDFATVLKEAQDLGYAEADPGFDIDGVDAAHKLAILASLAFGVEVGGRRGGGLLSGAGRAPASGQHAGRGGSGGRRGHGPQKRPPARTETRWVALEPETPGKGQERQCGHGGPPELAVHRAYSATRSERRRPAPASADAVSSMNRGTRGSFNLRNARPSGWRTECALHPPDGDRPAAKLLLPPEHLLRPAPSRAAVKQD